MSFDIFGYDVTGGWSLQKYSPQKGHKVRLWTNLKDKHIEQITWTIYQTRNVVNYDGLHSIYHVFQKNWQGDLFDAEGWVKVKCTVKMREQELVAERDFLVVPEIKCAIQLEQWPLISSDTHFIDVEAQILCAAIELGMPFEDNEEYSCGGACIDQCPQYEIIASPIQGCHITQYGRHKVTAKIDIRGSSDGNTTCVSLYRENHLGENARYPSLKTRFCIFPRENELKIIVGAKQNRKRRLVLQGLSEYMLPKSASITWKITRQGGRRKTIVKYGTGKLNHTFRLGTYKIVAEVRICDEVTRSKCHLSLLYGQEDMIEYLTDPFTYE